MTQPTTPAGPSTGELRALRMTAQRLAGLIDAGDTAAVSAALAEQPRLVGIPVERDGQDGWTPLHLAVAAGSQATVEVLVTAGADLDARTERGRTPLQVALESAPDLVPVLQSLGAPVDAATASFTGDRETLLAVLDGGAPLTDPHSGVDLLTWAAFGGHLDTVQLLLDRGADADGGALQAAAGGVHPDVVDVLLSAGARVDRRDPDTGRTALHAAVAAGAQPQAPDVVARLLDAGADVDATTADGANALDIAQIAAARERPGSAGGATPHDDLVRLLEEHRTHD
ncbi:MAG: hypothetical protein JWQ53_2205 [Klenkia sp.]|nr:hypothetical protein [Klenkia sp.]